MQAREYKFSVIVLVGRDDKHLAETIESILRQSVGFKRHVQLILVNNGVHARSEAMCLRYEARYPENITYLRGENAGVSAARNAGLHHARGRYINLLDCGDVWERRAFGRGAAFLDAHPDIGLVAAGARRFGTRSDDQNQESAGDGVVDIEQEHRFTQMHVAPVFIRRETIRNHEFDVGLRDAGDLKFLTPIILDKGRYAVLRGIKFCGGMRRESDAALLRATRSRSWYLDTPTRCHRYLIECSRDQSGRVPAYVQYAVMCELQGRFARFGEEVLTDDEARAYREEIAGLLREIDDAFIVEQRHMASWFKLFALGLKRGLTYDAARRDVSIADGRIEYCGHRLKSLNRQKLLVEIIEVVEGRLILEGSLKTIFDRDRVGISFRIGDDVYEAELLDRRELNRDALGETIHRPVGFRAVLPLSDGATVSAWVRVGGRGVEPLLSFGRLAPLSDDGGSPCCRLGEYSLSRTARSITIRRRVGRLRLALGEARYLRRLGIGGRLVVALRLLHWASYPVRRKRTTWLLSDRVVAAGDNGEALFAYATKHAPPGIRVVFAISSDCPDYPRLKGIGRVVPFGSVRYRMEFLFADKIVSSAADGYVINAFGDLREYMKDLYAFDFVFLQHGVTQSDLSGWLNKYRKNMRMFVTTAVPERDSILSGDYYYADDVVKLTGLPRHDLLLAHGAEVSERKLIIMPTWRKALTNPLDPITGLREPFEGFTESDYFRTYQALLTDPRLLEALERHGFSARFLMHPALIQEADAFPSSARISVERQHDYRHEFRTADIMVTDYSSVAFDFALLRKPVVYLQTDHDEFFNVHFCEPGYFEYERDGFGPVCRSVDATVDAVIATLEGGCRVGDEYRTRIEAFFGPNQGSRCEAVQRAILDLGPSARRRR